MLYVIEGEQGKALAKLEQLLTALLKKEPDAHVARLDAESFKTEALPALVASQGLFVSRSIIVLRRVFEDAAAKAAVLEQRKEITESANAFFLLEEKIDATTKKKLERLATKWESVGTPQKAEPAEEYYNRFVFADALVAENRQKLWVEYQKAKLDNVPDEVLVDALAWQLKTLLLAAHSDSPEEAGLKAFPYKKAKTALQKFPASKAAAASQRLLALYHDARRGKHELSEAFERFLLSSV